MNAFFLSGSSIVHLQLLDRSTKEYTCKVWYATQFCLLILQISDIPPVRVAKEVTAEDKTEAERLKNAGNEFMKAEQFIEAVNSYTQAIAKDPNNAIYYSNRWIYEKIV